MQLALNALITVFPGFLSQVWCCLERQEIFLRLTLEYAFEHVWTRLNKLSDLSKVDFHNIQVITNPTMYYTHMLEFFCGQT